MTTEIAATQHTSEERNWAMAAHLLALVAVMGVPFGHVIGPLVVYLTQRDRSPFVASHARASLNFQITVSIAALVFFAVAFAGWAALIVALPTQSSTTLPFWVLGGWIAILCMVLLGAAGIIVLVVMGAVAASNGRPYRYPLVISFVR
jgi:uncharacterized Tic20 family protein